MAVPAFGSSAIRSNNKYIDRYTVLYHDQILTTDPVEHSGATGGEYGWRADAHSTRAGTAQSLPGDSRLC